MALKQRNKAPVHTVAGNLWLDKAGEAFLGHGRIELLQHIDEHGSISAAARAMGMSYKAAWQAVDAMNNLADRPLVDRSTGGLHGGGTRLTEEGRQTVAMFRQVEDEYRRFLARLSEGVADFARFNQLMRRLSMKTSARNQFLGKVIKVTTNESIEDLKLKKGREAYALIKASAPLLVLSDDPMRSSARNRLCGTVVTCIEGAVNGEVGLELAGGKRLTAIITNDSIRSLGLKEGVAACALIKASNIIIAVND